MLLHKKSEHYYFPDISLQNALMQNRAQRLNTHKPLPQLLIIVIITYVSIVFYCQVTTARIQA